MIVNKQLLTFFTIFFFFQEEEKEANSSGGLKNPDFVPKSIFEKNTSPSLQKP